MALHAHVIYLVCLFTSIACTGLLYRGYRRSGIPLLLWSALCFVFLSVNNLLLYIDVVVFPGGDLRLYRLLTSLIAVTVLLYSFIWEAE